MKFISIKLRGSPPDLGWGNARQASGITMSSQWTNKYAIMRDLSLAQGFALPMDLTDTVAPGEKPPILSITEENEDFYNHKCEDGDGNTVPDLTLIQHMLKMVHPVSSDSEDDSKPVQGIGGPNNTVIEITKPAPTVKEPLKKKVEFVLNNVLERSSKKKEAVKNVKRKRVNVAVDSILQGLVKIEQPALEIKSDPKVETMILLKPNDFMTKKDPIESENLNSMLSSLKDDSSVEDSIGKVNQWLSQSCDYVTINDSTANVKTISNSSSQKKKKLLEFEPSSMFRKKNVIPKPSEISPVKTSPIPKNDPIAHYKPTELADEYYKRFLEHMKVKETLREDLWAKAEKIMKEIDAKRAVEAIEAAVTQAQTDAGVSSCDPITLPQHRHLLTGDCLVCEIVKKNGIDIDLAILQSTEYDNKWLSDKLKLVERGKNYGTN